MADEPLSRAPRRPRILIAVAASALLALASASASAQAPDAQGAQGKDAQGKDVGDQATASRQELSPELMYRLLVGDIALQRGQPALAARAYFEAARESHNAAFARRAMEIALATRQGSMALQAARLWSDLDPSAERPRDIAKRLATEGVSGDAVPESLGAGASVQSQLERVLAEAAQQGPKAVGEAFLQLDRLFGQEQDRAATLALVQALAAPYDKIPEAHVAVAVAALGTGLSDMTTTALAMREIDRALALDPASGRAAVVRAQILQKQSTEQAIAWLGEFLKNHPGTRPVAGMLAQLLVQEKRYGDARAVFDAMLEREPKSPDIRMAQAALSMQMKDWERAEAEFGAIKRDNGDEDGAIALSLAEIAEESGRLPLALERYRAVPDGERGWLAQLRIATVLAKMKRQDEALRHLADLPAVTIEQRVQVRQTEAQLYRDAGDYPGALRVLEKALGEHPDNPDLLYDAAMVAEKLDRVPVTEQYLRKVVELRPDNAQAWNALGYTIVDRTNRYAEGMEYIERAHKLSPDDAFILDSLGWAHYRMGRLDDAERYLRQAIAGRPDAEIAAHLGEVLWVKGEHDRAREVWQSQLKTAPDNPVLLETVRRLAP